MPGRNPTKDAAAKLSRVQKAILARLYDRQVDGSPWSRFNKWGSPWGTEATRSEAAARSRALKRLEERGLVLRQNYVSGRVRRTRLEPHSRTTHVQLTPAGVKLVERLDDEGKMRRAWQDASRF